MNKTRKRWSPLFSSILIACLSLAASGMIKLGIELTDYRDAFKYVYRFTIISILLVSVYFLLRLKLEKILFCILAFATAHFSMLYIFSHMDLHLMSMRIALFPNRYQTCLTTAVDIGNGHKLNLCEKLEEFGADQDIYAYGIVYDSSDAILHGWLQHSDAWRQAAFKLFHPYRFYTVQLIRGHFYAVTFSGEGYEGDGRKAL